MIHSDFTGYDQMAQECSRLLWICFSRTVADFKPEIYPHGGDVRGNIENTTHNIGS